MTTSTLPPAGAATGALAPQVSPTNPADGPAGDPDALAVIELLLKNPKRLDDMLRDENAQRALIPKLLGIAMAGFAIYGVVATAVLNLAHHGGFWLPYAPPSRWNGLSVANLTLAYSLGLIAANGICLPSFYFYTLLAGVRITMVGIVAHAAKGMAIGALMLVGIVPIYVAVSLYVLGATESETLLAFYASLVLTLPFVAGIWGAVSLYRGFLAAHCGSLPMGSVGSRACMLRRLILAWSGCYTFVTPLVIYSLWQHLGKVLP